MSFQFFSSMYELGKNQKNAFRKNANLEVLDSAYLQKFKPVKKYNHNLVGSFDPQSAPQFFSRCRMNLGKLH